MILMYSQFIDHSNKLFKGYLIIDKFKMPKTKKVKEMVQKIEEKVAEKPVEEKPKKKRALTEYNRFCQKYYEQFKKDGKGTYKDMLKSAAFREAWCKTKH